MAVSVSKAETLPPVMGAYPILDEKLSDGATIEIALDRKYLCRSVGSTLMSCYFVDGTQTIDVPHKGVLHSLTESMAERKALACVEIKEKAKNKDILAAIRKLVEVWEHHYPSARLVHDNRVFYLLEQGAGLSPTELGLRVHKFLTGSFSFAYVLTEIGVGNSKTLSMKTPSDEDRRVVVLYTKFLLTFSPTNQAWKRKNIFDLMVKRYESRWFKSSRFVFLENKLDFDPQSASLKRSEISMTAIHQGASSASVEFDKLQIFIDDFALYCHWFCGVMSDWTFPEKLSKATKSQQEAYQALLRFRNEYKDKPNTIPKTLGYQLRKFKYLGELERYTKLVLIDTAKQALQALELYCGAKHEYINELLTHQPDYFIEQDMEVIRKIPVSEAVKVLKVCLPLINVKTILSAINHSMFNCFQPALQLFDTVTLLELMQYIVAVDPTNRHEVFKSFKEHCPLIAICAAYTITNCDKKDRDLVIKAASKHDQHRLDCFHWICQQNVIISSLEKMNVTVEVFNFWRCNLGQDYPSNGHNLAILWIEFAAINKSRPELIERAITDFSTPVVPCGEDTISCPHPECHVPIKAFPVALVLSRYRIKDTAQNSEKPSELPNEVTISCSSCQYYWQDKKVGHYLIKANYENMTLHGDALRVFHCSQHKQTICFDCYKNKYSCRRLVIDALVVSTSFLSWGLGEIADGIPRLWKQALASEEKKQPQPLPEPVAKNENIAPSRGVLAYKKEPAICIADTVIPTEDDFAGRGLEPPQLRRRLNTEDSLSKDSAKEVEADEKIIPKCDENLGEQIFQYSSEKVPESGIQPSIPQITPKRIVHDSAMAPHSASLEPLIAERSLGDEKAKSKLIPAGVPFESELLAERNEQKIEVESVAKGTEVTINGYIASTTCAVCLEEYSLDDLSKRKFFLVGCGHTFCSGCIDILAENQTAKALPPASNKKKKKRKTDKVSEPKDNKRIKNFQLGIPCPKCNKTSKQATQAFDS
ncbi:hypothetical protein D5018_02400 [Parashewanella curva]|uniref:RING-type domain-containing protein n=1 Tax=Parashewanella curva TaxID=2338552 RepID=A0A3L8Q2U2_9GAMM|nr:RING finger protein [Parashewanella curva]RLV61348.1 hypothetical protein D5018_02400 [Parashewanella curva]